VTMLPASVEEGLRLQLDKVRALHAKDIAAGGGEVELPGALARKLSRSGAQLGMAVGVSRRIALSRPGDGRDAATPPTRVGAPACGARSQSPSDVDEAGDLPQPPAFVRDPSPGGRVRYPDVAGAVGAQGCQHDDDLHARVESGRAGGKESGGWVVGGWIGCSHARGDRYRLMRRFRAA